MPMGGKSYDEKGKVVSPSQMGEKGIPPGVGSGGGKPKGIVVPSEMGSRGKPHNKSFPNTPPARD